MICHIYILVSGKKILESAKRLPLGHEEILLNLEKDLITMNALVFWTTGRGEPS